MVRRVRGPLEAWLRRHGDPTEVEVEGRSTVGLSQNTWFVRLHGDGPAVRAVLRLPTPASGNRAIVVQRSALQFVAGNVPTPTVLWFDDGEDNEFGSPFLVMERLDGHVPVGWHEIDGSVRTRFAAQAMDVLAALHAVDVQTMSVAAETTSVAGDLSWYLRRFARLGSIPPVLEAALWWLERHQVGPPIYQALVHGDFRMGNLMIDGGDLVGVLDWEMAAPGDPLADLAWCFIPVWLPAGVDEGPMIDRYAERSGRPVDPERFRYYRVLGYVRLAYYALAGMTAFGSGRSDDFRLGALRLQLPVHLDRLMATLCGEEVR